LQINTSIGSKKNYSEKQTDLNTTSLYILRIIE